jgi:hypothetical protein
LREISAGIAHQMNYEENFICSTNYFYIDYTEQQKIQNPGGSYENEEKFSFFVATAAYILYWYLCFR